MSYTFGDWDDVHDWRDRRSGTALFVLHTGGSGIVTRALDAGLDPNAAVAEHYDEPGADGPHELVTWDPEVVAALLRRPVAPVPDSVRLARPQDACPHAGWGDLGLRIYADADEWEHWEKLIGKPALRYPQKLSRYSWWRERWPGRGSPFNLVPPNVRNPNECTYSFEMVQPVHRKRSGGWGTSPFTPRMHDVAAWRCAALVHQLGRGDLVLDAAKRLDAFVGHEDLNPVARFDGRGGWDPGGRGPRKLWDWDVFHARLDYWLQAPPVNPASGPAPHP